MIVVLIKMATAKYVHSTRQRQARGTLVFALIRHTAV